MNKKKIIIDIHFNNKHHRKLNNGMDNTVRLTKEWIEYRMSIFMKYTLNSLMAQTNHNFTAFVKYDEISEDFIQQALQAYPSSLPENIRFIRHKEIEQWILGSIGDYKYLYLVRLDSDDMYHKTFIQQLHHYRSRKGTQALINQKGYKFDSVNHLLAVDQRKSPPFYTLLYLTKDYLNGHRIVLENGHPSVRKLPHEVIGYKNYVYVIHGQNIAGKFKGEQIIEHEPMKIEQILSNYMNIGEETKSVDHV